MGYLPDDELKEIAKKINKTGTPVEIEVYKFLDHFKVTRRKTHVKWWIDKALKDLKIKTVPDYKSEYYYSKITLKRDTDQVEQEDFIQRLKLLDSANSKPVSVTKNCSIEKAMTLMMTNDFSQLPVMNSDSSKSVDGMISWNSIGWARAKGKTVNKVSDCYSKDVTILDYDSPILDSVNTIKDNEVVLVEHQGKITGLLTITDIAEEFFTLAEPFLYLGQIETSLRVLLDDKFTIEELKAVKFGDDEREINSVSDLNFSEYIQLLRTGDNWNRLKLPLDKDEFTKKLDEVREIRNEVMHFSSDSIEKSQEETLKQIAQFLKEILS
jgi:predicted transcriptional regulator